jgi:hypothetical protein
MHINSLITNHLLCFAIRGHFVYPDLQLWSTLLLKSSPYRKPIQVVEVV